MGKSIFVALAAAVALAVIAAGGLVVGLYYANQGKRDTAEEARENAERGAALLKEKDYGEAIKCLTAAIRYDPNDPVTLHHRGLAYAGKGDYEKAIDDFNSAIRLKPTEAEYFTHRAEAYQATQQYDKALTDFTQALEQDADYVPAFRGRGAVYLEQKKYAEAAREYGEALKRDDHDPSILTELARAEYHLRDLPGAKAHLDAALDLDANYAEAYMLRGLVYAGQQKYDRALADFGDKIRLADDAEARYQRGDAHLHRGDKEKALADFTAATRLDKRHGPAHAARGRLYFEAKKYKESAADFGVALAVIPTEELFYLRGLAYLETGEYSEAAGDFTKALDMNPLSSATEEHPATLDDTRRAAETHNQRALANLRARNVNQALQDANLALDLAPKNFLRPADRAAVVAYLNNRAAIFIKEGREQHDKAEKDLDAALALDPANVRAINTLGELHYSQGEYEKAVADYDRAIALNEKDAPSWNHRGLAYQKLRGLADYQHALGDFRKAIELDPNYAEALNNCAWLLATCERKEIYGMREEAVPLAQKALKLDGNKTARYMSTLAAAYAAQLQFEQARTWEQNARNPALPNSYDREELVKSQKRLESYGRRQAWEDKPGAYDQ
jgi:tetratricopeptide (TPR) repeat protein